MLGRISNDSRQSIRNILGQLLDGLVIPQCEYSRQLKHKHQAGVVQWTLALQPCAVCAWTSTWNLRLYHNDSR